jgi:hypothetical protein
MAEQDTLLAELERIRERATGLVRAKLNAISEQVREAAARIEGDMEIVIPPDPEAFLPLSQVREIAGAMVPPPPPRAVDLELLRALDAGRAQSAVLHNMLARLDPWCGRRAVVVLRDGKAAGWAGAGFDDDEIVRGWQAPIDASGALSRVADGAPVLISTADDGVLKGWLEGVQRALLVPMSLRGKVVGALLAGDVGGRLEAEPIQLVAFVVSLLLETLAARSMAPSPALREAVSLPHEAAIPAVEEAAVVEERPAAEGIEETAVPAEAVGAGEGVEEIEVEQAAEEAELEEAAEAEEIAGEETTGEGHEPATEGAATVHLEVPIVPIPPPRAPEEERKHEEAKRFARLLVSEIRLYNEQAVVDGKQNRDIYQRLKEDIDRSREMYEQRVSPQVRAESNYFFEELVRILGDGNPDVLGL